MVNRLHAACLQCLLKHVSNLPAQASEIDRISYMQKVFCLLADAPCTASAPVLVEQINQYKREFFGAEPDFTEQKQHFNAFVLSYVPTMEAAIRQANDPLLAAMQFALIGNYIDFGAMQDVNEADFLQLLKNAQSITLSAPIYQRLRNDLSSAQKLVFLTDNCGEIVADKLLIQAIQTQYPQLQITVLVRGKPVLNDATLEDAQQVGLTDLVTVLPNGNGIAGTCLERLSPEAQRLIQQADLILSKGQGNFETLRGCGKNVYYLFLCKCDLFAQQFQVPKMTGILTHDSVCTDL